MSNDIPIRLQAYYARTFPDQPSMQIGNVTNLTTGWECDLYAFTAEYGTGLEHRREELILRLYVGEGARDKAAHEFHSLRRLREVGYPVPQVYVLECDHSPFGKPFVIMEKVQGQVMWSLMFGGSEQKQQQMLTQFCQLFVQLHTLDWRLFAERDQSWGQYAFVDHFMNIARGWLDRFPALGMQAPVAWLEKRRDSLPCARPSPIHNDFHPNNLLVRQDGSALVIDWTGFHISDARFDLAWTLMLANAYLGTQWRDRFLRQYERAAGTRVEHIERFEVMACLRRLGDILVSLTEGADRQGMRPEAAAIMKQQMQVHRRVYDLLVERTGIRIAEVERLFA